MKTTARPRCVNIITQSHVTPAGYGFFFCVYDFLPSLSSSTFTVFVLMLRFDDRPTSVKVAMQPLQADIRNPFILAHLRSIEIHF